MTDEEHVKRIKEAAQALIAAIDTAQAAGLSIQGSVSTGVPPDPDYPKWHSDLKIARLYAQ